MYIATVPNRSSPPAILLRESYRQDGKVKTRTLANLSKLPSDAIAFLKRFLAGELHPPRPSTVSSPGAMDTFKPCVRR